ncbi:MAG: DUF2911 domain-containing protein [Bryobacterales bacterium]|nr:DUF2911 domain-containing protein [Bryobacterales bacterium]
MRTLTLFLLAATLLFPQEQKKKKQRASPPVETSVALGGKNVTIKYSSPSMKGRKIFGELVPFGKVWRAGANEATALHTDADIVLGDLTVPAGDYTLFVIPEANSWTLIVNKQTGQWGLTYNQDQDLGRTKMSLSKVTPVESYKMTLSEKSLKLEWEETAASVSLKLK